HQANHQNTEGGQDDAGDVMARNKEVDGNRSPDQRGAHSRQQGQHSHQHTPEQGALNVQEPEHDPAQRTLSRRHSDIALDGGAYHGGEFAEQVGVLAFAQRDQLTEMTAQLHAIAQQKEQHVQHDAQADQELEGVLAYVQSLFGQELSALNSKFRELLLQGCKVMQAKTGGKI